MREELADLLHVIDNALLPGSAAALGKSYSRDARANAAQHSRKQALTFTFIVTSGVVLFLSGFFAFLLLYVRLSYALYGT